MAGSRKPGPQGMDPDAPDDLDDGTLVRAVSPRPGPVRDKSARSAAQDAARARRRYPRPAAPSLRELRQGNHGADVKKLQLLLNARLTPSPALRVDGLFGSVTTAAVVRYQLGVSVAADAVVGKQTWYRLLKGDQAFVAPTPAPVSTPGAPPAGGDPAATSSPARSPTAPSEAGIWEWPLEKKLLAVLERVPKRLQGRARDEFLGLLKLENLALSLAIIAGLCLLSGGTALVLGFAILGVDVSMSLAAALQIAALAATPRELDEAADELAHIVIAVGVTVFFHGVGKVTKGVRGGGKGELADVPKGEVVADAPPPRKTPPSEPAPQKLQPPPEEPLGAQPRPPKAKPLLRQEYERAVAALADKAKSMRDRGSSTEEIARALHAERRTLGQRFKALTPPDELARIYARNLKKYGDELGPTLDWLRANGKSWEQILESAQRAGGKDLGF